MSSQEAEDQKKILGSLIDDLCKAGKTTLDEVKLKQIKNICKSNEECVEICYEMLMKKFNEEHSQVRYSALQIVDCLFQRSHTYRELILDEFQAFFELVLETDPDEPLPPPRKIANELKKLAAKVIKTWHEKFGAEYKLLDLGFNYLKNCKKVDFVSFSHQNNAQRVHAQRELEKQQIFLNKKYGEYVKEMREFEQDIRTCAEQLDRCIGLLIPKEEEKIFDSEDFNLVTKNSLYKKTLLSEVIDTESELSGDDEDDSDEDFVEVTSKKSKEEVETERNLEMRYFGIGEKDTLSVEQQLEIDLRLKVNEDNETLIEIMRGLYKELKKTHLTRINNWMKNFTSVRNASNELKRAIELKNLAQSTVKKYDNLNIAPVHNAGSVKSIRDENLPCTSKSKEADFELEGELDDNEMKLREKLKIAPVIEFDDVEHMGAVTHKVEADHPIYARRDDNEIDHEQQTSASRLVKTTFAGKFVPVVWQCRAPMKNGKLCPRMDRVKCPLHGKVVARDETGRIVNESDRAEFEAKQNEKKKFESTPWLDTELIADINASSGKRVISSDANKEADKKRKSSSGNLINVNKELNSSRRRLEKRLLAPKNLNKLGSILDGIERRRNQEKFHHYFAYALQS